MAQPAILAIALFSLASLVVGIRLVLLARRTRELPELLAGLALLGLGPFGFGLTVLSTMLIPHSLLAADLLWAIASLALNAGCAANYVFSYRVFHPGSRPVRGVVGFFIAVLVALWLIEAWLTGFAAAETASFATRAADWMRGGALLWGAFESLRYWTLLRRRLLLGLADAVTTRRFLLWGVALLSSGITSCIDATMKLIVARSLDFPALSLTLSVSGLMATFCLMLAFWPRGSSPLADSTPG